MKRDSILNNERQPQEIDIDKLTDRNMVKMEEEDGKEETEINEPQIEDQGDGVVEMQGLFLYYLLIFPIFFFQPGQTAKIASFVRIPPKPKKKHTPLLYHLVPEHKYIA